jgi:hypothetical protein
MGIEFGLLTRRYHAPPNRQLEHMIRLTYARFYIMVLI